MIRCWGGKWVATLILSLPITAAKVGDEVKAAVGSGDAEANLAVKARQNIVAMRAFRKFLGEPHVPRGRHATCPRPIFTNGVAHISHPLQTLAGVRAVGPSMPTHTQFGAFVGVMLGCQLQYGRQLQRRQPRCHTGGVRLCQQIVSHGRHGVAAWPSHRILKTHHHLGELALHGGRGGRERRHDLL